MKKRRIFTRAAALLLAVICLFSLCSCFDYNYKWDLPEREKPDIDLSELFEAIAGEASSEVTMPTLPPVDPVQPAGAELIMTLSDDGGHYIVAGTGDKSATEIEIPETYNGLPVAEIADEAFKGMNKLKSISIPDSVLRVGMDAFDGCYCLEYAGLGGHRYLGNDKNPKHVMISCSPSSSILSVNATTLVIADGALSGLDALEYLHIPESIVTVGSYAISNCSDLAEVYIGSNVQYIGSGAFYGCTALESVTLPDSVTYLGEGVFNNCRSLHTVIIGNGVRVLRSRVFGNCTSLTSIKPGDGLEHIEGNAFVGCSSLSEAVLPMSVAYLSADAFNECDNLNYSVSGVGKYLGTRSNPYYFLIGVTDENVETLNMDINVGCIAYGLFGSLENLTDISIGSQKAGEKYLRVNNNCVYALEDDDTIVAGMKYSTVTTSDHVDIGAYAFYGCDMSKIQRLPYTTRIIGNYAFANCSNLSYLRFYTGVESIGDYAFVNCTSISSCAFSGGSLKSIGEGAFSGCTKMSGEIKIPDGVEYIGAGAFDGCDSIESLTLPDSLLTVGGRAFANCTGIKKIFLGNGLSVIGNDLLYNCRPGVMISFNGSKSELEKILNIELINSTRSLDIYCTDGAVACGGGLYEKE